MRTILAKTWRLTLFGILASYLYTAYYFSAQLILKGGNITWGLLGDGAHHTVLFIVGMLFFFPLVGAVASFLTGLAATLVTGRIKGMSQTWRERTGLIAVAAVTTGVLGLPVELDAFFATFLTAAVFFAGLLLGAFLLLVALKWPKVELWARRAAGGLLGLATVAFSAVYLFALPHFDFTEQPANAPGPNVLVIVSDAHRADIAETLGGDVPTPNLDRLARRGVRFDRCYSTSNWTIPAVASIYTGTSRAVHCTDGVQPFHEALPSLQLILSQAGYRCWGLFCNTAIIPQTKLYQDFDTHANYDILRTPALGVFGSVYGPLYRWFSYRFSYLLLLCDVQHIKSITPDLAVELAARLKPEGGTFAYVHLFDPHTPYAPPDRYVPEGAYDGDMGRLLGFNIYNIYNTSGPEALPVEDRERLFELYRGEIRYEDEVVGKILDELERTGAIANTAVFFVGDHGEEFWDHGGWGHGRTMYDEVVRVPLIATWPGVLPEGELRSDRVSIADIFPTVLDALGIGYDPAPIYGRSLALPPDPGRAVYAESTHNARRQITVLAPEGSLILDRDTGEALYFLPEDLTQKNEVGEKHPEMRERLLALIREYDARQAELREAYNPVPAGYGLEEAAQQLENLRAIGYLQ